MVRRHPGRHSIYEDDVKTKKLRGRTYKLLFSPQGPLACHSMCGGVSFFPPGKHSPSHIHKNEEEIVYVLAGSGQMCIGSTSEKIKPGAFIHLPKGIEHSVNNTGKTTIKLLFVFSPPAVIGAYKDIIKND